MSANVLKLSKAPADIRVHKRAFIANSHNYSFTDVNNLLPEEKPVYCGGAARARMVEGIDKIRRNLYNRSARAAFMIYRANGC
jgi:hypothetical protein